MTTPDQVIKSINATKHLWVKAKLQEIFQLSLPLVEEFEGQDFSVYQSDHFARKSLPVLEAMCKQKTGKKIFIGVVSNALVGITNTMSFFWWTPTRLMSKNDLQYMTRHVENLKARLAESTNNSSANASLVLDKSVGTHDIILVGENDENVEEHKVNVDDFESSDGEIADIMEDIVIKDFNKSKLGPVCSSDGNGNDILPKPNATTSTPKAAAVVQPSQKKLTQEHRQSMMEKARIDRRSQLENSKLNWKSMLESSEDEKESEAPESCLRVNITLKNKTPGGIILFLINVVFFI